jgi:hypothetical protein
MQADPEGLAGMVRLDLAMSDPDQIGRMADAADAPGSACDGLDLGRLAARAPALRSLRVSGCQAAIHGGLGAFGSQLTALELADVVLDGVTIGRLGELTSLTELTLTRVALGAEPITPLQRLSLRRLVLRELAPDSEIALLLGDLPASLEEVVLDGAWAGHSAMLSLGKAKRLRALGLLDTRIGNFSLNQLKGLAELQRVRWVGSTFNDSSPLYVRELPLKVWSCACPNLGDGGLRALRYVKGLEQLELLESRITGAGLQAIVDLDALERMVIRDRDIGAEGMAALGELPRLRELVLVAPTTEWSDPTLAGLERLQALRTLELRATNLDDRAAPAIAALTGLERLSLSHAQLSDVGVAKLNGLTRLRELDLGHTRVTHRGLAVLGGFRELRRLALDHTDVVDGAVFELVGLAALEELRLDGTLVTDGCAAALLQLPALRALNLADTVISREGAQRLRQHPNLQVLGLERTRAQPEAERPGD